LANREIQSSSTIRTIVGKIIWSRNCKYRFFFSGSLPFPCDGVFTKMRLCFTVNVWRGQSRTPRSMATTKTHTFTNAEYADIIFAHCFCDANSLPACTCWQCNKKCAGWGGHVGYRTRNTSASICYILSATGRLSQSAVRRHCAGKRVVLFPHSSRRRVAKVVDRKSAWHLHYPDMTPQIYICGETRRTISCHGNSGSQRPDQSHWGGRCRHRTQTNGYHQGAQFDVAVRRVFRRKEGISHTRYVQSVLCVKSSPYEEKSAKK
jgi:hypothetical protein